MRKNSLSFFLASMPSIFMHSKFFAKKNDGYMWWINAGQAWKGASRKVYYALGFGGNYIVIDSDHDLVVVARWMDEDKMGDVLNMIVKSIETR